MKKIINPALRFLAKKRVNDIYDKHKCAGLVQAKELETLIKKGSRTDWGKKHNYSRATDYEHFRDNTPLSSYEEIYHWIDRAYKGEKNVIWPGLISKFAKSSGTTNARSKYIPITKDSLLRSHNKGGKDMSFFYLYNYPDAGFYLGKTVGIGGSLDEAPRPGVQVGDLSAVIMDNLPGWAQARRAPGLSVAMMSDWDKKLVAMSKELVKKDVRALAGVPTWTLLLVKRAVEDARVNNIREIWPNLEVFFHGAVAFDPYRETFRDLFGEEMRYLELYNASEGFFGIQDDPSRPNEMLLMLDYGIFYEFITVDDKGDNVLTLEKVQTGVRYELIITTNGGLWRYRIGDVVEFTSLAPYRIKISGRTKHFINAFGEELMVSNAEIAIAEASRQTNATVTEYTAGPKYMGKDSSSGRHEWAIEFEQEPGSLENFTVVLDKKLKEINSDYDAKRKGDLALLLPEIRIVKKGSFRKFLEARGEITGRNKVPRLANNREFLDQI